MDVDRTVHIGTAAQDAAMQCEAGSIDAGPFVEVVVHADLDEVGRGHLGVEKFVALDEKVARIGGAAHGGVVEDHVAPAVVGKQSVHRGKVDTGLPVRICGRRPPYISLDVHDRSLMHLPGPRCNAERRCHANAAAGRRRGNPAVSARHLRDCFGSARNDS